MLLEATTIGIYISADPKSWSLARSAVRSSAIALLVVRCDLSWGLLSDPSDPALSIAGRPRSGAAALRPSYGKTLVRRQSHLFLPAAILHASSE